MRPLAGFRRRRRPLVLAGTVTSLAIGGAAGLLAPWSGSAAPPASWKVYPLGDSQTAVAVGSPEEGTLEVQYRDERGRWSARHELPTIADGELMESRGEVRGTTLAYRAQMMSRPWADDPVDDPHLGPRLPVFVVCQPETCVAVTAPPSTTTSFEPVLTPDGGAAYFGRNSDGYVMWSEEDGLSTRPVTGVPDGVTARDPLLAPDGSLRLVVGRRTPAGCSMTLLTSGPGEAHYRVSATFDRPHPQSRPDCSSTVESVRSDSVTVTTRSTTRPVFLALHRGAWVRVEDDPSGLVHLVRRDHRRSALGSSERVGPWHGLELVVGSPDGRTLTVQTVKVGATTWSPVRSVARAPAGLDCFEIAPTPTIDRDPFYVTLRCRSLPAAGRPKTYTAVTAVTDDGIHWKSTTGDDLPEVAGGDDLLFPGPRPLLWSEEDGLQPVGLPVPAGADYSVLSDGTSVLTSVVDESSGSCRLQVRLAGPQDTRWRDPVPNTSERTLEDTDCALPHVSIEGTNAYYYHDVTRPNGRMDRLIRHDGEYIVEAGPPF